MSENNDYAYTEGLVTVSTKVSRGAKARLLREANKHQMTLSAYTAFVLDIEGENLKELERLNKRIAELELKSYDMEDLPSDGKLKERIYFLEEKIREFQTFLKALKDAGVAEKLAEYKI